MGICSEKFDTDQLFTILAKSHTTLTEMASFTFDDTTEVIEQLARAKRLFQELEELKDLIVGSALSGILCSVIEKFDLQLKLQFLEDKANTLAAIVNDLDDAISQIDADDFDTFEGIESQVSRIFEPFDEKKEQLFAVIKEETKNIFSVLVSIGAEQSVVDEAIENVELTANIKDYVLDVFNEVLDNVLQGL